MYVDLVNNDAENSPSEPIGSPNKSKVGLE